MLPTKRRLPQLLPYAVAIMAGAGCVGRAGTVAGGPWLAPSVADAPVALVSADAAEFVFPADVPRRFLSTAADSTVGDADQGFLWWVSWAWRLDDHQAPVGVEARSGPVRRVARGRDTLQAVLSAAELSRLEPTMAGDHHAATLHREPALSVAVRGGHVVLSLRGRDGLRRVWPGAIPESVTFYWWGPGQQRASKVVPLVRLPEQVDPGRE